MTATVVAIDDATRREAWRVAEFYADFDGAEDMFDAIIATLNGLGNEELQRLLYSSGSKPVAWIAREYGLIN